jgi:hypothetical protein
LCPAAKLLPRFAATRFCKLVIIHREENEALQALAGVLDMPLGDDAQIRARRAAGWSLLVADPLGTVFASCTFANE